MPRKNARLLWVQEKQKRVKNINTRRTKTALASREASKGSLIKKRKRN